MEAISCLRELLVLFTFLLIIGLLVGTRLIGTIGVSVCPTIGTLDQVLRVAFFGTNNETEAFYSNILDSFVTCTGDRTNASTFFGVELNSSNVFFESIEDLGYECYEGNSTLYCTNTSLPCGFYNETTIPTGLEYVCQCKGFVQDMKDVVSNCDASVEVVELAFEGFFCSTIIPGITLSYISLMLLLLSLSFTLLVFTILNKVHTKVYSFADFD